MNRVALALVALAVTTLPSGDSRAQPAPDHLEGSMLTLAEAAIERAKQRLIGVDMLVRRMEQSVAIGPAPPGAGPCAMGGCVALKNENGEMRLLTPTEVQMIAGLTVESAQMTAMGAGMIGGQDLLNRGLRSEIAAADPQLGTLASLVTEGGPDGQRLDPWMNPFQMIGAGGLMVLGGAQALDEAADSIEKGEQTAHAQAAARDALMENGRYVGIVDYFGRQAHKIMVEGINQTVTSEEGDTFTMQDVTMLIDTEELVMLMHRMDGTATQDGEVKPFFIETEQTDFRRVPGTDLYEPYETVSRMGGMLNDEQRAQLNEARGQLASFEKQLAAMPADQRAMAERMMGGQMEMMRSLVNTGNFEFRQKVLEIYVNPDLAALYGATGAAATGLRDVSGDNLVARIQADLKSLGYDPGNVDGELSTQTVIAISQFQAENGLEVNGEPSEALARALAQALGR